MDTFPDHFILPMASKWEDTNVSWFVSKTQSPDSLTVFNKYVLERINEEGEEEEKEENNNNNKSNSNISKSSKNKHIKSTTNSQKELNKTHREFSKIIIAGNNFETAWYPPEEELEYLQQHQRKYIQNIQLTAK